MNSIVHNSLSELIKRIMILITAISVVLEMLLFPSIENMAGCIMMVVTCFVFTTFFLEERYIIETPFSFLMLCSITLFHFLPVPATLISFRPVSYGMVYAVKTFGLETIMFLIGCAAFYCTSRHPYSYGLMKKLLNSIGFYNVGSERLIWTIGFVGLICRLMSLSRGGVAIGILGSVLNFTFYYVYMPILLFFPCLYRQNRELDNDLRRKDVWLYIALVCVLNVATNSRKQLITPFCIFLLLLVIAMLYKGDKASTILNPKSLVKATIIVAVLLISFETISKAMLITRSIRRDVSFTKMIELTVDAIANGGLEDAWEKYKDKTKAFETYDEGWTEEYVKSTLLSRFCNIRITDETLYLESQMSEYAKKEMQDDFEGRLLSALPEPIIKFFNPSFDKSKYTNARGDALYIYSGLGESTNWGEFRVTSHLGDGLATFGLLYFPFQFIMWCIVMKLLNTFSMCSESSGIRYSLYGLLTVYDTSLLAFVNGNGICDDVLFLLRGYWQDILLATVIIGVSRILSKMRLGK